MSAVDKSRSSKSVEVRRVWEIYDDRLQFMPIVFLVVLPLVKVWFLGVGWLVSGLFGLGEVPKVRSNAVDVHDAADVFFVS